MVQCQSRTPFFLIVLLNLLSINLFLTQDLHARPEYAAKEKLNCVSCHALPWGGGPRNIFGKTYGNHGVPTRLSNSDLYYGDLRFIYYLPQDPTKVPNGLALMQASATANVPISDGAQGEEMRTVATFNIASLSGAQVREAYIRWQTANEIELNRIQMNFGRFYVPFGLLTDEHRTYTRLQTNMTLNNYSVGASVSGNVFSAVHYDFALVNDFQTDGMFTNNNLTLGAVLNFRWNPQGLPFFFGVSGNIEKILNQLMPYASSIYTVLSLDRLTSSLVSGSLSFERVDAYHWNHPRINTGGINPSLHQFFVPTSDIGYFNSVQDRTSLGYYGQFRYNLSSNFRIFYKFDYLSLDKSKSEDAFMRHGVGFEVYFTPNLILNARFENAVGMRPEIKVSQVQAAQDDIFVMLRLWI